MVNVAYESADLAGYLVQELPDQWILRKQPRHHDSYSPVCARLIADGRRSGHLMVHATWAEEKATVHWKFQAFTHPEGWLKSLTDDRLWFETPKEAIAYWELTK